MTLEELIRRFRSLSKDQSEPYLWPDEDVTDWLNDAQAQACVRGRLIREDANSLMCRIALDPAKHTYPLHKSVYEIIHLRLIPLVGKPRTMHLKSREWLDAQAPDWRDLDQPACWAIQNDTTVRVVGQIIAGDVLELECYRLPMKLMAVPTDKPEIHQAHHEHMIQWALHKAFSIPDADTFDSTRETAAETAFTSYFGPLPDSDLRRTTRTDQVHANVAYVF